MKVKTSLLMMGLGMGMGAAGYAYFMSSNKTKQKANEVINTALDNVNQKMRNKNKK